MAGFLHQNNLDSYMLNIHIDLFEGMPADHLVSDDHLLTLAQLSESSVLASPLCTLNHLSVCGKFTANGLNSIGVVLGNHLMMASLFLHSFRPCDLPFPEANASKQFASALSLLFQSPNF